VPAREYARTPIGADEQGGKTPLGRVPEEAGLGATRGLERCVVQALYASDANPTDFLVAVTAAFESAQSRASRNPD